MFGRFWRKDTKEAVPTEVQGPGVGQDQFAESAISSTEQPTPPEPSPEPAYDFFENPDYGFENPASLARDDDTPSDGIVIRPEDIVVENDGAQVEAAPPPVVSEPDYNRIYPRSPDQALRPEMGPPPPAERRSRNSIVKLFNGIISAMIFFLLVGAGILFVGYQLFTAEGPLEETSSVIVPSGEGLTGIATRLEREGVISDTYVFLAGVSIAQASSGLKAGEYVFQPGVSMMDVMETLTAGNSILHSVTIPEGRTSEQVVEILRADSILEGEITEIPPEGTLLPETYKFTRGFERQAMIDRMRQAHEREVERIWAGRDPSLPLKSPEELVILASIVEKETGRADERPQVAAVFTNRLNQGIRLQSDPTIIYGIVGGKGSLGRPIRRSEIDAETPYNTYQIDGLPPTAIANPGVAALEATANPSRTSDLFFVADGTGGHAFATTLAEHNRNVARWRQIENQPSADPEPAGDSDGDAATGAQANADPNLPPVPELNLNLSAPLIPPPAQ